LSDGLKAIGENSHKEILDSLINYKFSSQEIMILQDLRKRRNKSMYEGKQIEYVYLENKEEILKEIIMKLKIIINKKLCIK